MPSLPKAALFISYPEMPKMTTIYCKLLHHTTDTICAVKSHESPQLYVYHRHSEMMQNVYYVIKLDFCNQLDANKRIPISVSWFSHHNKLDVWITNTQCHSCVVQYNQSLSCLFCFNWCTTLFLITKSFYLFVCIGPQYLKFIHMPDILCICVAISMGWRKPQSVP